MPGDDEAIAGVVAFAAEDDDGAIDAQSLQHVDATTAGVFHEDEAWDAVILDRTAIYFAALVTGEDWTFHTASVLRPGGVGNACVL